MWDEKSGLNLTLIDEESVNVALDLSYETLESNGNIPPEEIAGLTWKPVSFIDHVLVL